MSPLPTFTAIFVLLFIRFAQPHTPEPNGVSRTRKKFAESNKQRQNPISRKAFPSAIDFIRMRFADYRYNRKNRLLRCCFSMHSAPPEGVISHRNALRINNVYFLHRKTADGIGNHIAGKPPFPRFGLEPYIGFRPDNKDCYVLRTY